MSEDEALLEDFQASQRRKQRIAAVIVTLAIAGFAAMKLYQGYLRADVAAGEEALQRGQVRRD